jgi:hypothetical protein
MRLVVFLPSQRRSAIWGIAAAMEGDILQVAGEPRGRADTPGFYRSFERKHGQQVTKFGVPPLLHKKHATGSPLL